MLLAKIAMNFWHSPKTVEPGPKPVKFLRADDIRGSPPLFPKKSGKGTGIRRISTGRIYKFRPQVPANF